MNKAHEWISPAGMTTVLDYFMPMPFSTLEAQQNSGHIFKY